MATGAAEAGARAWPQTVAVIGAGTMGLGVAEQCAAAGLTVRITDRSPEATALAYDRLMQRVRGHAAAGIVPPAAVERCAAVVANPDLAATVAGVDFIFEAVFEQQALKHDVLARVAKAARPDAVIVSNTSSFPIDDLAEHVLNAERFLGLHWFNPPEWTPGVEVIPHATTDPAAVAQVVDFLRALGKRPTVIRSAPGFVANRIQNALFREALACVEDGLASPREVDEVCRSTFGFRMPFFGPFLIADMAGLDVWESAAGTMERAYGERFQMPQILHDRVAQGKLGTKTGAGFFTYTAEERDQLLLERDRRYAALNELLTRLPPITVGTAEEESD
ncbi:MAG: 3-hydroxyacyl-CoA dehydrogenase family protein [Thermomicrobia bacterium]|nr:3-hydroxyacyl-CoA dehydrogenase family protein [Thermomicrobia bacterium]MCA1722876.1 3-hydroxyacyl-CoA dehydrogenase family protein [Thermomicrobia bacterium]